jgi:pimeloyl-ACP methyl ester carboxylesterase
MVLKTIRTSHLQIAYEEGGLATGRPVILLHGFPDDPRSWDSVVAPLTSAGFRTIVPYLRGFGPTRFLRVDTPRSGQQAALANDLHGLIDGLALQKPILAGYDWGARAACTTAVLWPEGVSALLSIGGYNIQDIDLDRNPADARQEQRMWYQWYFHTERGRAGLKRNCREICRLLWESWSLNWKFTDDLFEETARSFDNQDFVEVVIHSYRHRYGAAEGDPELEKLERRLAGRPRIGIPTVVLHGEGDGVHPVALSEGQEELFTAHYERKSVPLAGHFFPREAPEAVVEAIRRLSAIAVS